MTFENNTRIFFLSSWLKLNKVARDYYNRAHEQGKLNIVLISGQDA